jgi:hypothetical protein
MTDDARQGRALKTILAVSLIACASCSGSAGSKATTCEPISTLQCNPPGCYPTWADVQASTPHCNDASGFRESLGACDGYFLYLVSGVDFGNVYYYDKTSGALVAAQGSANFGPWCAAGAGSVPPSATVCPTDMNIVDPCMVDAGPGN